jgi:hypothetical protein
MKSHHSITHAAMVLFGLTLATSGCSRADRDQSKASPPPPARPSTSETTADFQVASDAVAREANLAPVIIAQETEASVADHLSSHTFDERDALVVLVQQLVAQADTDIAALKIGYNDMLAGKSQQDAMAELDRATSGFKAQADTLAAARAENWDTVKSAVVSFWVNLQTALAKARAGQV